MKKLFYKSILAFMVLTWVCHHAMAMQTPDLDNMVIGERYTFTTNENIEAWAVFTTGGDYTIHVNTTTTLEVTFHKAGTYRVANGGGYCSGECETTPEFTVNGFVEYTYDNAGNRIKREIITIDDKSAGNSSMYEPDPMARIDVYPNPVSTELNINFHTDGEETVAGQYILLDMNGRQVRQQKDLNPYNTIDVGDLTPAMYILRVSDGTAWKEYKIIKK